MKNSSVCHPERRGRRGDRGVEGPLWPPANSTCCWATRLHLIFRSY